MSFTSAMKALGDGVKNLPSTFQRMPVGKKVYALLWAWTAIVLFVFIGLVASWTSVGGKKPNGDQIDAIAAVALLFFFSLVAAVFSTVLVSAALAKAKKSKGVSK